MTCGCLQKPGSASRSMQRSGSRKRYAPSIQGKFLCNAVPLTDFHPQAPARINQKSLTNVLYLLGYTDREIAGLLSD